MADYSMTINTAFNVFGLAPPSLWAQYNWGSFKWGEGTNGVTFYIEKMVSTPLNADSEPHKYVDKPIAESFSSDSEVGLHYYAVKAISETISVDDETTDEQVTDGSGYNYVFPDRATNAEDRDFVSWSTNTVTSATWVSATVTSTTWS